MQNSSVDVQELGPSLGYIESTSEKVQMVICGAAVLAGIAASSLKDSPAMMLASLFGVGLIVVVGYFICKKSRRFSSRLDVYQDGVQLNLQGNEHGFRFRDLREFKISETDHYAKGMYVGTRARLHFLLDGRIRPISCELEHKKDRSTGTVMAQLTEISVSAVRDHLSTVLERKEELRWTPDVYLTMDALQIHDGSNRVVPIEDITQCTVADNQMKFWKCDEAMPFLVMSTDHVNFFSIAQLFRSLHECYRQGDSNAAVPVDHELQGV